jgi:glutamate synthase (NADPH/NADH) small chain
VAIDIPRFIRHLLVKDVDGALGVIREASILPSVCGRVCPQERQCESQCVIARKMEPVAIGRLERYVGDHGTLAPEAVAAPTGKRVAVVGSGPAGLACAADLARAGVEVTIIEALHVTGGVLRYGIPSFRLPREIIDREVAGSPRSACRSRPTRWSAARSPVTTCSRLAASTRSSSPSARARRRSSGIPARTPAGGQRQRVPHPRQPDGRRPFPHIDTPVGIGTDVVVVGAGNTAMDCLRVARRLGADVRCVYRRSGPRPRRDAEELRHAEEEGVEFLFLHNPVEVLTDEAGHVRGLRVERMELGEPDDAGGAPGAAPASSSTRSATP